MVKLTLSLDEIETDGTFKDAFKKMYDYVMGGNVTTWIVFNECCWIEIDGSPCDIYMCIDKAKGEGLMTPEGKLTYA